MNEQARVELVRRIDADVISAMKAHNAGRVEALRMVKSALRSREIDKREPLTEAEAQAVLGTLLKQRRESVEQFTKGNRLDLAEKEAGEITLIEAYLPRQADAGELNPLIDAVLGELQAGGMELGPKAIGAAMKAVNERIARNGLRADGRQVSEIVKAALAK